MVRDGVALVKFWYWLENSVSAEEITEASAGERLRALRSEQPQFRGESFHPIVGYEGNGAIIHYAAEPGSAAVLHPKGTVLVDSGGHYSHGTTDVTRVIPLGPVDRELCTDYTLVLKAHLSLAMLRFPARTSGHQLDAVARSQLWRHGLNYGHGTGHGVGFFLNVHEGPQRLSSSPNTVWLRPGMVVSNEPGHYRRNRWGIRLENLVAVKPAADTADGEEFLEFETLTLCPIDTSLIEIHLLTDEERRWLNAYHERVYRAIAPHVNPGTRAWLLRKTEQI
jgi:Xaa-Pro aminopeptidase